MKIVAILLSSVAVLSCSSYNSAESKAERGVAREVASEARVKAQETAREVRKAYLKTPEGQAEITAKEESAKQRAYEVEQHRLARDREKERLRADKESAATASDLASGSKMSKGNIFSWSNLWDPMTDFAMGRVNGSVKTIVHKSGCNKKQCEQPDYVLTLQFDQLGRVLSSSTLDGSTTRYEYYSDSSKYPDSSINTNSLGNRSTSRFIRDEWGNVSAVELPDNKIRLGWVSKGSGRYSRKYNWMGGSSVVDIFDQGYLVEKQHTGGDVISSSGIKNDPSHFSKTLYSYKFEDSGYIVFQIEKNRHFTLETSFNKNGEPVTQITRHDNGHTSGWEWRYESDSTGNWVSGAKCAMNSGTCSWRMRSYEYY